MAPTQLIKSLPGFLSSVGGISAIYDEHLNIFWTDSSKFFDNYDVGDLKEKLPIKEEILSSMVVNGEKMAFVITPIYKSKYAVIGYVFRLVTAAELYPLANKCVISDYAGEIGENYSRDIEKIKELNEKLKADISLKNNEALLQKVLAEQERYISSLCSEIENNKLLFVKEKNNRNCNITDLVNILCNQLSNYYKGIQRKIVTQIDKKKYFKSFDYGIYAIAFMTLIKYHTLTCPLKGGINISGGYFEKGMYGVTIKTKKNLRLSGEELKRYEYCRDFAKKIFVYDLDGQFGTDETDKYLISIAKVPVFKKNRGNILELSSADYLSENFKPCQAVLKEQVYREIEELELLKMEASKQKKLAKQND